MAYNFNKFLISGKDLQDMPPITIDLRSTDKKMVDDKKRMRLDNIAGDVYSDETLWKVILWANPDYYYEYDIPDGTVIRIPLPKEDVLREITTKIITTKDIG